MVCTKFCDERTRRKQYDKIISTGNALVNLHSMKIFFFLFFFLQISNIIEFDLWKQNSK
jgi:hypothetical protein